MGSAPTGLGVGIVAKAATLAIGVLRFYADFVGTGRSGPSF